MTMIAHIGLTVMVLESIRRKDIKYLGAAITLHTLMNFIAITIVGYSILYSEMIVTGFALGLGYWTFNILMDEGVIG